MRQFLRKRWFLVSLLTLIVGGLTLGAELGKDFTDALSTVVQPRVVTALVLFLMAFSLDSAQLKTSFRSPGPVALAFAVNFGLIPLMGYGLMQVQLQPDFAYGIMIAASVPCTMAAASVWTRKAGGNDAVSLLVTVSTNGLCFLLTPLWLNLTTTGGVALDFWEMFWRLVSAVLLPTLAGQLLRQVPRAAAFAVRHKSALSGAAMLCILAIVFSAACRAGLRLGDSGPKPNLAGVALVWSCCIAIHLAAMGIGISAARLFGYARPDRIAVAFAGSQKTLPIGVLLATDATMFGDPNFLSPGLGVPFVVFPMLMYHASQLFIDTAVADRFARTGAELRLREV